MKTEFGIWTIDRESGCGSKLDVTERFETEEMLEDILMENPDMLMRGLALIGRQVPVGTGYVDLLGIDEDGRLVVFELKRGKLTRDAVAQILDYCTYLETLADSEIESLIAEESGKHGTRKIEDFQEWYANQPGDSIRPIRMVLVGLGINTSADRMVGYLAARDIDIRLLTFHGYSRGDSLLLAREVRTTDDAYASRKGRPSASSLKRKANEFGVAEVWEDAKTSLDFSIGKYYTQRGITFLQRTIILPDDVPVRASHSVSIDGSGKIRITFYPAAVDLGGERLDELKNAVPFRAEKPPNAPATRRALNQWYCSLEEESWHKGKAQLVQFVRDVEDAWRDHEQSVSDEAVQTGSILNAD